MNEFIANRGLKKTLSSTISALARTKQSIKDIRVQIQKHQQDSVRLKSILCSDDINGMLLSCNTMDIICDWPMTCLFLSFVRLLTEVKALHGTFVERLEQEISVEEVKIN